MTLVDTSVWIDHLRRGSPELAILLENVEVLTHPFVLGELMLGRLQHRADVMTLLAELPSSEVATHGEALAFVERHDLAGSGIGWVDVHLLAAAALTGVRLWTLDRKLGLVASRLGLAGRGPASRER